MVDIQAKVWRGYAIAASKLASPVTGQFNHYRPNGIADPLATINLYGALAAAFDDKPNYQFAVPNLYGHPERYALIDGSLILPGDYLTNGTETYFVAAMPALMPIVVMTCNLVLTVKRPFSAPGVGMLPYGGDTASQETPVMTNWPGWCQIGTKGEVGSTNLPGDVRSGWYQILLPALAGTKIEAADVIDDNLGRRYKVSSCELSQLGWRLTAMLAET